MVCVRALKKLNARFRKSSSAAEIIRTAGDVPESKPSTKFLTLKKLWTTSLTSASCLSCNKRLKKCCCLEMCDPNFSPVSELANCVTSSFVFLSRAAPASKPSKKLFIESSSTFCFEVA